MRLLLLFLSLTAAPALAQQPQTVDPLRDFQLFTETLRQERGTEVEFAPPDLRYRVPAAYQFISGVKPFEVVLGNDRTTRYVQRGAVDFEIDGQPQHLNVYQDMTEAAAPDYDGHLYVPFTDGEGTPVRYVRIMMPAPDQDFYLDFNTSYRPSPYATENFAPLPPQENQMTVRIPVGERIYIDTEPPPALRR